MSVGNEAAVEAVEMEAFAAEIPSLIPLSKTLYSLAQARFTKQPVSYQTTGGSTTRPSFRVPFRWQGGAALSQGTGNGDSLGRGNASQWADFVESPVWNYSVCEITHLAQLATNGRNRAKIAIKAEELKNSLDSTIAGIEGLMYGSGAGDITQIPSTATVNNNTGTGNQTSSIVGIRAMALTDNQVVQFFPSIGGSARSGTATVSVVDPVTSTVYFSTALPTGTATGDYIMVNGASGAAYSGIIGTQGWINNATTGTIGGINRANYPSRITSPSINLNGGAVTASLSQRIEALLGRAMGASNPTKDSGIYIFPEDQALAVAQTNYYNRQITQNSDRPGNTGTVPDVSRKFFQNTFGGRECHLSYVQPLGRVDMLLTSEWYIGELVPLQLYDFGGGNTVMPVPDPNGNGWLTSTQFAYETSFNLACSAPRHQLYVYGASSPTI